MQQLLNVSFESGALPGDWIEEARQATFDRGVLRSGGLTRPAFLLPGKGWGRLSVEIALEPGPESVVDFGNGRTKVIVCFGKERHRVTPHEGGTLAMSDRRILRKSGVRLLVFEFDHGLWRALVDGEEVISYRPPSGASIAGLVTLSFFADCAVHRVRVAGDEELAAPAYSYPARRGDDFSLEVTVDFPDDLYYGPYTPAMLNELFAEYVRWGVRRCHWFYYGKDSYNWWRNIEEPFYGNYRKTLDNFGEEIFDAAVRAGHKHGIEVHGLFKPFEMAEMLHTYGPGTEEARKYGRLPRIGGVVRWCCDFAMKHRELMTRRRPGAFGPAENDVFTRIDLVGDRETPADFRAEEVRLFVSDDNNAYRPYEGPCDVEEVVEDYPVRRDTGCGRGPAGATRRSRVMRFRNLNIRSNFIALVAPRASLSFGNRLADLVHVFGPKGEESRITLGLVPRAGQLSYSIHHDTVSDSHGLDFCRFGIEYDNAEGMPSACKSGYEGMREWHAFDDGRDFDGGHGFIGIARGKDETAVGIMSPSFVETRQWWLQWVRDILEAGADGVELRVRNHHTHLAWEEFGFEKPLRDAFLARHGVDIWKTDDFDRAAWRRLRGEAYTQFYRDARRLVDSYGKRMGVHVSQTMDMEPEQGAAMGIHFDWRTWIDEGLADSVTMKEVWPRAVFAEEILSHTRPRGVPVIFCPYANHIWKRPGGAESCAKRIRLARDGGYDGFQFYENCAVMRPQPDGRLEMAQPELRNVFQREFGGSG